MKDINIQTKYMPNKFISYQILWTLKMLDLVKINFCEALSSRNEVRGFGAGHRAGAYEIHVSHFYPPPGNYGPLTSLHYCS